MTGDSLNQQGVAAVSEQLFARVTHYHAAIGADVSTSELAKLEAKLLEEGRTACYKQEWDEALNLFTHALAVFEKSKTEMATDSGNRGTLVHNIAFCLHVMGEFEAAKAYYEQSLECFQKIQLPMYQKVINGLLYPERLAFEALYGGLNHNRIQMTKERLLDLSFERKPDLLQLDQWGRKKPLPDKSAEAPADANAGYAEQTRSYLASWVVTPPNQTYSAAATAEDPAPDVMATAMDRRPGWLAASEDASSTPSAPPRRAPPPPAPSMPTSSSEPAPSAAGETHDDHDDSGVARTDEENEAARVEWLQYYLKTGEWARAAELVVTSDEREDLAYLQERDQRDTEYSRRRERRARQAEA